MVLASIVAALVIVVLLAGGLEQVGTRAYTIRFTLAEGVAGLEPGSKVFIGGQPVGVVAAQAFGRSDQGHVQDVVVRIRVDREIALRQGAVATLISPLLGGSATINFPTIGEGAELTEADEIDGQIAPPGLLAQAGYGAEQAAQLKHVMARAVEITDRFYALTTDTQAFVGDLRVRSEPWLDRVDSIAKNVDETAAKGPALADSLEGRLAQIRDILEENRPAVREAIVNAQSVSAKADVFMDRLNGELTELAVGILHEGREAVATGRGALERAHGLLGEQSPNIRRSIANFRLASEELTAMMNEVRRSPWRLLYRPDKREMDFELLYDSARAYAGAIGDLRAATEAMQSVAASGASSTTGALPDLVAQVEASFDRYKAVESEFLRQIMERAEQK